MFTCAAPLSALHWLSCLIPVVSVCLCFHQPSAPAAILSCTYRMWPRAPLPASIRVFWSRALRRTSLLIMVCSGPTQPETNLPNNREKPSAGPGLAGGRCQGMALIITFDLCTIQAPSPSGTFNIPVTSAHFSCFHNRKTDTKTRRSLQPEAMLTVPAHPAGIPTHVSTHTPDVRDTAELFLLLSGHDRIIYVIYFKIELNI